MIEVINLLNVIVEQNINTAYKIYYSNKQYQKDKNIACYIDVSTLFNNQHRETLGNNCFRQDGYLLFNVFTNKEADKEVDNIINQIDVKLKEKNFGKITLLYPHISFMGRDNNSFVTAVKIKFEARI